MTPTPCDVCASTRQEIFLKGVPDRLGMAPDTFTYARCLDCGLVGLSPRPTFEQTSAFYPRSFYRTEQASATTPSAAKRFEAWFRNRLISADFAMVRPFFKPGLNHLDVGCSTGDFIELCRAQGVSSVGIELSEDAAEHCRSQKGLDVVAGDLVEHDFGGKKFDLITYNGALEHLPNPYPHLMKCRELLAPGGQLIILGLPNIRSAGFRLAGSRWIGLDTPRHIHQFSKSSLERMLKKAGFEITRFDFRSPRFNPPSLIASVLPSLHRHKFDEQERRTGKNPILKKAILMALLQLVRPLDWCLSKTGLGEHMIAVTRLKPQP